MTWNELLDYCLAKPGAWQDEPWGDGVVTKVGQKIFAFLGSPAEQHSASLNDSASLNRSASVNRSASLNRSVGLKCAATREAANEWLLRYPDDAAVMPYIGRSGWNNLRTGNAIPDDEIFEAIDASYAMVVSKLPKSKRPPDECAN